MIEVAVKKTSESYKNDIKSSKVHRLFNLVKDIFLDLVAAKAACLSITCLIISFALINTHIKYLVVYFFVTISWTFGSLPLHVICLITPISLQFICGIWTKCFIKGFLLEESLGILSASIFYFTYKTHLVTRKVILSFLIRIPTFPHNLLTVTIATSVSMAAIFPDYAVVLIILPFVQCLLDIFTSIESKIYNNENMEIRQFDKAFKLGICYSASIGSIMSMSNSEPGEILFKLFYKNRQLDFDLWFKVVILLALTNSLILWLMLMVIFLGPRFTKHCFYLNFTTIQRIFFRRKTYEFDKNFKMYMNQLDAYRKEIGPITLTDLFMIFIMIIVIILALTRKSLSYTGWSDWILNDVFELGKSAEFKEIHLSFILCSASVILFLVPSNKLTVLHLSGQKPSDTYSMSSNLQIAVCDWELVCKYIPWTAVLFVGASNNLFHVYQQTGINHRISIGLTHIFGPDKNRYTLYLLYFISMTLNIFNLNTNLGYAMAPIAIHVARYKNMNVTEVMLYSLYGTRNSFITPFSNRANLLMFFMAQTINRRELLKAGLPMTILSATTTLLFLIVFKDDTFNDFDPKVLPQVIFHLLP